MYFDVAVPPLLVIVAEKVLATLVTAFVGVTALAVRSARVDTVTSVQLPQLLFSFPSGTVPTNEALLSAQTRIYLVPLLVNVCDMFTIRFPFGLITVSLSKTALSFTITLLSPSFSPNWKR